MGFAKEEGAKLLNEETINDYGTVVEIAETKSSKKEKKEETSNILHLFKFTTRLDRTLLIIGILFSIISGACLPILGFFFGGMTNIFINQAVQGLISDAVINQTLENVVSHAAPVEIRFTEQTIPLGTENDTIVYQVVYVLKEIFKAKLPQNDLWGNDTVYNAPMTAREFENTLNKYLIIYLIIGTIMMICSFMQTMCWEYVSEHQVYNIRKLYFTQIIRQDISWYDTNDNGNLPNKLSDDLERIREGTGYKCAMIVQYLSTFFAGIAVGLYVNTQLTLVTLCVGPFLIGLTAYSAKFAALSSAREQEKYAAAGAIAEETLSNIKTVSAFCGQIVSIKKYGIALEDGRKIAMKKYDIFSVCFAITFFLMYAAYGLGFWYGSNLVQRGISTPGSVFTVFFSVVVGAFSIGNALPYFNSVSSAVGVITSIRQIMSRKVDIDPYSESGRKLDQVKGNIEFKNVSFSYPSRPHVVVLNNMNLKISSGQTVAIVGSSGAGKSTIVGLLLRFYDTTNGTIYIDDNPINELNVNWMRKQIGLVSQEPVLFGVTIAENIRYGREDVTLWEIIDAAKGANAHDFITKLPKGYETLVGDTGSQLSGGQKQRIAIARALVRNPKILLLDEATSALDSHSEGIVQEALEKAMTGRTTIIVAHRLSTIRDADTIHVMQNGALFESGSHDELMEKRSLYYNLVTAQTKSKDTSDATSADETNDESTTSAMEEADESPEENKDQLSQIDEEQNNEKQETSEEMQNNEKEIKHETSTDVKSDDNLEKNEPENHHEENKSWKVLDREVSHETLTDDDDEEYETIVTHVRETREILFDEEDEENEPTPETMKDTENLITKEPESCTQPQSRKKRRRVRSFSLTEDVKKDLPFSEPEEIEREISMLELLKLHKPEWPWLMCGLLGAACVGLIMPIFSLYYGQIFAVFTKTGMELKEETMFWTYMFAWLSIFTGIAFYCQAKGNTTVNETIIARVRLLVFENILRQPVGWFDLDTSSPGVLVNRLARNAPLIKAAAGMRAGQVLSSAVTLVAAFIIAYIYGWKLALVLTICVPIIIYASHKQHSMLKKSLVRDSKLIDEAGRVASETVRNIRTVQALGQEKLFVSIYSQNLETPYKEAKKQAFIYSALYAATQAITYYMYAIAFRIGGYFVEHGEMETSSVYKVFFALSLCAASIGNAFSFMQDYTKARTSVRLLNYLLNRRSEIDSTSPLGIKPTIRGKIQFRNVQFSYPARPNVKVLRGLNLNVEAGKTLALVGESGCGKSTVISLLERFYDPLAGSIKIDGYDIRTVNLAHLRSKIGLVTQEPILFDYSIRDNIAYGAVALQESVSFDDIVRAAKLANVHDFVMNLPERYDTIVGERGIQLSGGQKQRVAIARALIRDPKILLLDEATSALDTENEKIVQEALDIAKKGRTCIVVAHRLSTIQNADKICVMQKGKIIEKGTHEELLAMEGHYYQLTQRQVV